MARRYSMDLRVRVLREAQRLGNRQLSVGDKV